LQITGLLFAPPKEFIALLQNSKKMFSLIVGLIIGTFVFSLRAHDHKAPHPEVTDYKVSANPVVVGQREFQYKLVPGWATHKFHEV